MKTKFLAVAALTLATSLAGGAAPAQRADVSRVEPELLGATSRVELIARFDGRVPALPAGVQVLYRFGASPAIYATADPAAIRALSRDERLVYAETVKPIAFDLDSATTASRARRVWGTGPGFDPITVGGSIVDGAGVGIAIVDTGLDALHPDLAAPGKVAGNYLVTPQGLVESPYTVGGSPHGTHVAGIAAGSGATSGGKFKGAAPGATLYGFGVAQGGTIVFPAIAFDWILQHGAQQQPPIRIVNNSWHCNDDATCSRTSPDSIHVHLASQLARAGVVVTWSAGNDAGDGFLAQTNTEAINPTPGIISVANYDDDDRGLRTRCVHASSSRGAATQPHTWPDVAAPGRLVTSTWAMTPNLFPPTDTQYTRAPGGRNDYRQASGTSMAAPHVAGVAALLLQAHPMLRPFEVEYLLKATAQKLHCTIDGTVPDPGSSDPDRRTALPYALSDPAHPWDGANFFEGHGLIDARAAVEAALVFAGMPAPIDPEPLPEIYRTFRTSTDTQRTLYMRDPDALSDLEPTERRNARPLLADQPVAYTSPPLGAATTEAFEVELWFGTDGETTATYLGRPTTVHNTVAGFQITIEVVSDSGEQELVSEEVLLRLTQPGAPVYRRFVFTLQQPYVFGDADRVRMTLMLRSDVPVADEAKLAWVLYSDARSTPSNLALAHKAVPVEPGTSRECKIRRDCAEIGGMRELTAFECNIEQTLPNHPRVRVSWEGPPGSTAGVRCGHALAMCTVPGEATDPWSSCVAEAAVVGILDTYDVSCFYITRDGEQVAGRGRCEQIPMSLEAQN